MKVALFSTQNYEKTSFASANRHYQHELVFIETRLSLHTTILARGFTVISCFVTDDLSAKVFAELASYGVKLIALRSAGFNHVDLAAAKHYGIGVARVPAYSPYAVAEFAVGLILALNRKIHRAYNRVRKHDFLLDGLMGFDLHGRTVGIIGTGKIGSVFARIMHGFGCNLIAYDPVPDQSCKELGVNYISLEELYRQADIISLHCPLTPENHHFINQESINQMKYGVMIINTSRGALIDTKAIIMGLKTSKIAYLGIDVYEEEEHLFFQNLSEMHLQDDVFLRLETFPNVIITGHQAFFTQEAVHNIAETTLANIAGFVDGMTKIQWVSA